MNNMIMIFHVSVLVSAFSEAEGKKSIFLHHWTQIFILMCIHLILGCTILNDSYDMGSSPDFPSSWIQFQLPLILFTERWRTFVKLFQIILFPGNFIFIPASFRIINKWCVSVYDDKNRINDNKSEFMCVLRRRVVWEMVKTFPSTIFLYQ